MRLSNHAEQRMGLFDAINDPVRIKNLMATMFRVRLGEHHELYIRGISSNRCEVINEIIDFIIR